MWHWQNSCTYVSPCCSCRYTDRFRSELTHSIHCHICRATHAGEFRAKGRPPKLNAEVADAVFAEVTRRAIGIDALPPGIAPLKEVMKSHIQAASKNNNADVSIDATVAAYAAQLGLEENACDVKNSGRTKAFFDLRNHISQHAGIVALFDICHLFNMFSSDDVSSVLFNWEKGKKAWTTKEANDWNKEHGIGLSRNYQKKQRRVIHISNTTAYPVSHNPSGLVTSVLKLADWNFPAEPELYDLGQGRHVILYHPQDTCKVKLAFLQYTQCILPEITKHRYDIHLK